MSVPPIVLLVSGEPNTEQNRYQNPDLKRGEVVDVKQTNEIEQQSEGYLKNWKASS